jgi:putative ATPase
MFSPLMNIPLAERLRPKTLDDYVGQSHLVGPTSIFSKARESGRIPSMILWGPPGVGKTTLAQLLAHELNRPFFQLSAVNAGVKDVRETLAKAEKQRFFSSPSPILFIDEIHRFSKSQQDSLLGAVEKGVVTLIGATTENPSFEVISALLSRCQVYVLKELTIDELKSILVRALEKDEELRERKIEIQEFEALIRYAAGDARRLLNVLEIITDHLADDPLIIRNELVEDIIQKEFIRYDKTGDQHYDTISAFIKSVRGSDPDAAVYYLARMIEGGEDPLFICRRLVILAAEDIGLANPNALLLANACYDAVHKIGFPEGRIPMAECTIYLANSPKSNSAYMAIKRAQEEVRKSGPLPIPMEIRNAPTGLMKELGYGDGYIYPHDHPDTDVGYSYLPKELENTKFYEPGRNRQEERFQ